ncbi:DnaD domain protein [Lentibacillus cibarius]|uniref:DnaD domain protein n=2 Tax=Lentibacillus cibarius TaxID=2583219 RepID=A0A5S3R861_9BACI|nr:DnaD domain protein [Lentibacillus cibarius]
MSAITDFWDKNGFGANNVEAKKQLLSWLDYSNFKDPKEVILKAMNIACASNKRKLNYVEGILHNWQNESLLTIEDINNAQDKTNKTTKSGGTRYESW